MPDVSQPPSTYARAATITSRMRPSAMHWPGASSSSCGFMPIIHARNGVEVFRVLEELEDLQRGAQALLRFGAGCGVARGPPAEALIWRGSSYLAARYSGPSRNGRCMTIDW